jgi:hypothetical protein
VEAPQETIDYPFEEDLCAARRIDQASRDAALSPAGPGAYRMRTVEELLAPLTDPDSLRQLVEEEATLPEFRKAWTKP